MIRPPPGTDGMWKAPASIIIRLVDLPGPDAHGNRIYGKNQPSLAKRAGHQEGWQPITYPCRGVEVTQQQVRNVWSNIGKSQRLFQTLLDLAI